MRARVFLSAVLALFLALAWAAPAFCADAQQTVIYGQPRCKHTHAALSHYSSVTYHDVSKDEARLKEMLQLSGGRSVTPVIVIDGAVQIGFEGKT